MKRITDILENNKKISGYKIREVSSLSYELFFVHEKLETVRSTDTVSTDVTVYVDHDGKKGESSFSVYGSMTDGDIREKADTAADRALLVFNEYFDLQDAGSGEYEVPSNIRDFDIKELAAAVSRAVFESAYIDGSSVNALEIFVYRDTEHVINSSGTDKKQTVCSVMIEAIPTFTKGENSVELYEDFRFTDFDEEAVRTEIRDRIKQVSDRMKAVKPETPAVYDVAIGPKEIKSLLGEYINELDYASVYADSNLHKTGDRIQNEECTDKITLTMRHYIPGSDSSSYFDVDGTSLKDTCIIENGIVKDYFGSYRFGTYLGKADPTGQLPCFELNAGTLRDTDTEGRVILECASMSGLQIDLYNDYIGGEIRLAYICGKNEKKPVSGITMSGRLSEVMNTLRMSEKTVTDGEYKGPERIILHGMNVL